MTKKKIAVITATRAEYGLLKNVISEIEKDAELELLLWVTGTHLVKEYGETVDEIIADGFLIDERVPVLSKLDGQKAVVETVANAASAFGQLMLEKRPDMIVILGDRYELLPICSQAVVLGIPIAHISGGELTEGAIDDVVRHSVTKMSNLHFPGCEEYRQRIIQMGEEPERVFNYGDVGVENIRKTNFMPLAELGESLGIDLGKPYAMVTFHPATAEYGQARPQAIELFEAIKAMPELNYIITAANADAEGELINQLAESYAKENENMYIFSSLGIRRYLSAVKNCEFVLGNSSSGIVEAPTLKVPTVNIGNRQKGRLKAESIVDCRSEREEILQAMKLVRSENFRKKARFCTNPYGDGETSKGIVCEIKTYLKTNDLYGKSFYDLGDGK